MPTLSPPRTWKHSTQLWWSVEAAALRDRAANDNASAFTRFRSLWED